jgi:type IV secretory pathway VirB4 component
MIDVTVPGVPDGVLPPVVSADGALVYGIGGMILLIFFARGLAWRRRQKERKKFAGTSADEQLDTTATLSVSEGEQRDVDRIADTTARQRAIIAPAAIEWSSRDARVGEQWTSTLYFAGYPDVPKDGYLSRLFQLTDVEFDLTAHLTPIPQGQTRDQLQQAADNLRADADLEQSVRYEYLSDRAADAVATYTAVENGQRVFSQGVFITIRGETREALRRAVRRVRAVLREQPASVEPKTAICTQDLAVRAAAPTGTNLLGREAVALGGAVGALLASPHDPLILEPNGIEVGLHKDTQTPLVVDPFAREDGYAMFTVGDPGSGKSFSSKLSFLRTIEQDPDCIGVILEPLNNWAGVADALDATRITVGGTRGLNPLEIKPTASHVLEQRGTDASPLREKRDRVLSFFTNYFAHRGVPLGDRRTTLELALDTAYENAGITEDPVTHGNASPTVCDMLDMLHTAMNDSAAYVVRSESEAAKLETDAVWLLDQLRPFASGGGFENLGRQSEFDIVNERVVYLDMTEEGGTIGGHTSLLMELLISLVYERAKETDKRVVFVIDEARYLMKDAATLGYLETIFRHHRHHDLSIRLITQTVDEFLDHDIAKIILDQCAVKQFHKLDGMDERVANEFGLNHAQMRYVQRAVPGNETVGYAQVLLGVDGEWRGVEVRATTLERHVIENESISSEQADTIASPTAPDSNPS